MELNRIYCCDNVEGMKRYLPDESIDLTVTSPPYDNLRTYENTLDWNFEDVAAQLWRVTKVGGVVVWIVNDAVIKGSETGTSFRQALHFKDLGFRLHDTMIMKKSGVNFNHGIRYTPTFEFMFIFSKSRPLKIHLIRDKKNAYGKKYSGGKRKHWENATPECQIYEIGIRNNIWNVPVGFGHMSNDPIAHEHPAIFPESLARDHIISWSNEGDIVLDPFMGSGTTAVAALSVNRKYIGFEKVPKYIEIAETRIQRYLEKPQQTQLAI